MTSKLRQLAVGSRQSAVDAAKTRSRTVVQKSLAAHSAGLLAAGRRSVETGGDGPVPGTPREAHRSTRRRAAGAAVLAAGLGLAAATAWGGAHPAAASTRPAVHYPRGTVVELHRRVVRVTISNFAFHPARLVVSPGTRVIWTNQDSDPHTVSATTGKWASDALDTGDHYTRTFTRAGTLSYYCAIHPFMHGSVTVQK